MKFAAKIIILSFIKDEISLFLRFILYKDACGCKFKRSVFEYAPNFLKGELDIAPLTASIYDRRNRLPFYGEANNGVVPLGYA